MNTLLTYGIIFLILLFLELAYVRIASRLNIVDKPNERSSHSTIVPRGGGIIFILSLWVWSAFFGFHYWWFLLAVTLIAGVSFMDDIKSLPDSVRLVAQFVAMSLIFYQLGIQQAEKWWFVIIALLGCVGAMNIINFMDGINGLTAGYSLSVLVPLMLLNKVRAFVPPSLLVVVCLAVLVFSLFNFRSKAKCFAGDVGSLGIGCILLFIIGRQVVDTQDVTWLIFLVVYGVDGCLTIIHRIFLRENLGEPHRKHAYQLMANELKMPHTLVSVIYMVLQLAISLGFVFLCPNTIAAHLIYLACTVVLLSAAYIVFMKKYYHLHEEYLARFGKLRS